MSTASSDAEATPPNGVEEGEDVASKWVVRLFLILAFGLAFGIEGMTLIRSYLLADDGDAHEEVAQGGNGADQPDASPLRVGDDVLPATDVPERVAEMKIQGRSDGPWVFRLVVTVVNDGDSAHRLSLRELEADDGTVFDEGYTVETPPGDSAQVTATWPVGTTARPRSLTAEAELRVSDDSTRTVRRRVTFGHVPVQMER